MAKTPTSSTSSRIFSFIRRRQSRRPAVHEVSADTAAAQTAPVEAPNHELYELPVPPEPVELAHTNDATSLGDESSTPRAPSR